MFASLRKHALMKRAVWLMAAMVSYSPTASAGCACHEGSSRDECRSGQATEPQAGAGCCACEEGSKDQTTAKPQTNAKLAGACSCQCGESCTCNQKRVPDSPAIPPTGGNMLADQLALMRADVSAPSAGEIDLPRGTSSRHSVETALATSLQRCILLSRFTL